MIAKELDVQGHGIPMTVANITYIGMNDLHAVGGLGTLLFYLYLLEVKMDVDIPNTVQGNSFIHAPYLACYCSNFISWRSRWRSRWIGRS